MWTVMADGGDGLLEQRQCRAIGQPVACKVLHINGHDFAQARFMRKPKQRGVREVHVALGFFGIAAHPRQHHRKMRRVKREHLHAALFDPVQQLETPRGIKNIGGLDDARLGGDES